MHSLLDKLDKSKTVLDLGCGRGSFHYQAYPFRTIATDLHLHRDVVDERRQHTWYIHSDSNAIPLAAASVDVVICHNTLEHFPDYAVTLAEIRRVIRPDGWLWIAVPNGFGLDDALYRFVFEGGGHVNRFRFERLIEEVQEITGMRVVQTCDLFSSFIFLNPPTPEVAAGYPRTAHFLVNVPDGFGTFGILALNTTTRIVDRLFGSRWSQYGWGFVFASESTRIDKLPSFFNVCRKCGSGCAAGHVKRFGRSVLGLRTYNCPYCGELNIFVKSPKGLD